MPTAARKQDAGVWIPAFAGMTGKALESFEIVYYAVGESALTPVSSAGQALTLPFKEEGMDLNCVSSL